MTLFKANLIEIVAALVAVIEEEKGLCSWYGKLAGYLAE